MAAGATSLLPDVHTAATVNHFCTLTPAVKRASLRLGGCAQSFNYYDGISANDLLKFCSETLMN